MRIAIVNDMPLAVEALRRVVSTVQRFEIAWIAYDGAQAVSKCAADTPDLILMDLIMPVLDGVEATKQIMQNSPCAILVVTATVSGNASKVFAAMGFGALDAVNTPVLGTAGGLEGANNLLSKIDTIAKLIGKHPWKDLKSSGAFAAARQEVKQTLVAIAASTGGPLAVAKILRKLPKDFSAPIVIVQHVDAEFAPGLAEWLTDETSLPVKLVRAYDKPDKHQVLLAATNEHLILAASGNLIYTSEPKEHPYRPSADVFFRSLVENWKGYGAAVLLTGMGRDGAEGLLRLRKSGWMTIAQDKETSIVYGMPKAAAELKAAEKILPDDEIAAALLEWLHLTQRRRDAEL
ncbi:chemotaxis response regulator protein-glutamate methylesterase [bacterium]|nr:chemotaxis response regulator protein-glutamate methylesterase [bacterium]